MATTKAYLTEDNIEKYREFVLCYIDEIPATYSDYSQMSKILMQTESYKEYKAQQNIWRDEILKKQGYISSEDYREYEWEHDPTGLFKVEFEDYPNPDYTDGYTHYLYFTNDLSKQWGDDWNDAPYEHNAGDPYDDETEIIQVPVIIPGCGCEYNEELWEKWYEEYSNFGSVYIKMPYDYGNGNSPFCIDDINHGAVAWLYASIGYRKGIAIYGGDNFEKVLGKYERIMDLFNRDDNED